MIVGIAGVGREAMSSETDARVRRSKGFISTRQFVIGQEGRDGWRLDFAGAEQQAVQHLGTHVTQRGVQLDSRNARHLHVGDHQVERLAAADEALDGAEAIRRLGDDPTATLIEAGERLPNRLLVVDDQHSTDGRGARPAGWRQPARSPRQAASEAGSAR